MLSNTSFNTTHGFTITTSLEETVPSIKFDTKHSANTFQIVTYVLVAVFCAFILLVLFIRYRKKISIKLFCESCRQRFLTYATHLILDPFSHSFDRNSASSRNCTENETNEETEDIINKQQNEKEITDVLECKKNDIELKENEMIEHSSITKRSSFSKSQTLTYRTRDAHAVVYERKGFIIHSKSIIVL